MNNKSNKRNDDMKQTIKLNESQLNGFIVECVKRALSEMIDPFDDDAFMAQHFANHGSGPNDRAIGNTWLKKYNSKKCYTPDEAKELGYVPAEYQDFDGEYETWIRKDGQKGVINVKRVKPKLPKSGYLWNGKPLGESKLQETPKFEKNWDDDDKRERRTKNFVDDVYGNKPTPYDFAPEFSNAIDAMMNNGRIAKHKTNRGQKHSK